MDQGPPEDAASCTGPATRLTGRFEAALAYATQAHAGHIRKGTTIPYISHPLAVAVLVMESGGDEAEIIAALLHDTVEDAGGEARLAHIRVSFGDRVADVVAGCSDAYGGGANDEEKAPWRGRKENHLEHLEGASPSVLLVTAADKLHNARAILRDYRTLGEGLWRRFRGGRDGTLWYYRTVSEILAERLPSPLSDELHRTVAELEDLVRADPSALGS
jgi:(p)ppGpp synthase/HD superfamily hydrolase